MGRPAAELGSPLPFDRRAQPAMNSRNVQTVESMLSNLPASEAFTTYDGNLPVDAFAKYLPSTEDPAPKRITTEKNRCLIRALRAKPAGEKSLKRPAPSASEQTPKRARWSLMDREKKQACLRVALAAACRQGGREDTLNKLKDAWAENPRRKQVVNGAVRSLLCETVPRWSEDELKSYLARAGLQNESSKAKKDMVQAVLNHLGPEKGPMASSSK